MRLRLRAARRRSRSDSHRGVPPLRVRRRDPAGLVERAQVCVIEREVGGGEVVLELWQRRRADDDRSHVGLVQEPSDRDARRSHREIFGDSSKRRHDFLPDIVNHWRKGPCRPPSVGAAGEVVWVGIGSLGKDGVVLMNLCGRGDKDIFTVAQHLGVTL